jgi:hypothetical protein
MPSLDHPPSVTDEVIATIPELPREIEAEAPTPVAVNAGSWPDADYRGWSGL